MQMKAYKRREVKGKDGATAEGDIKGRARKETVKEGNKGTSRRLSKENEGN